MTDQPQEKPKIIIDEDWKSRVQAEKDQQEKGAPSPGSAEPQPHAAAADQLPPASFALLVTTLATQTMAALGQIPDPVEQKPVVRLDLGKHFIDLLDMLREKTNGNLDPEETKMLDEVLHQLRMLFVAVQSQGPTPGGAS